MKKKNPLDNSIFEKTTQEDSSMKGVITFQSFMQQLFDEPSLAQKASLIGEAILKAGSIRLSEIAAHMEGSTAAAYKRIQRFLHSADPRKALWRLFQEQASFVIGDATEIERPQAYKTGYVGKLSKEGKRGFWVLILATPYRGRAIPCAFVTYSSSTLEKRGRSRNMEHARVIRQIKELLGDRPLVLDREFSYLELLKGLTKEGISFVIRVNLGSHPPKFTDREGRSVKLMVPEGGSVVYEGLMYKGEVRVNVIGSWREGLKEPIWVMTNLPAEQGLKVYGNRMKIEQSFRDLKNLLGMGRVMNKKQEYMEKMVAFLLIVFAIGLLLGECLRDEVYGKPISEGEEVEEEERIPGKPWLKKVKKWECYSGLFVLLRQKHSLTVKKRAVVLKTALSLFTAMVFPHVLTYV